MKIWIHFLASLIIALLFYPIFRLEVIFIILGGVLIDIDHYFWYILKFKRVNIFAAYNFFIERFDTEKVKDIIGLLLVFHTIEFLVLVIFLSFYLELMLLFLIGLLSHYILDIIYLYSVPKRIIANHSIIYWVIKNSSKIE